MVVPDDRVLVLTSYGELPARVVGFDGERIMVSCPAFYGEPPARFLAWPADVRVPMDAAADELMSRLERLSTSRPEWSGQPLASDAGWPGPRKRGRWMERDVDDGGE